MTAFIHQIVYLPTGDSRCYSRCTHQILPSNHYIFNNTIGARSCSLNYLIHIASITHKYNVSKKPSKIYAESNQDMLQTSTPTTEKAITEVPASFYLIPNLLTYGRLVAIPLFILSLAYPSFPSNPVISATIFTLAALTDFLDGYLARKWKCESKFGAFLDPVADKLMVLAALVMLVAMPSPTFSSSVGSNNLLKFVTWIVHESRFRLIMAIPTVIIVSREIVISALREWMSALGRRDAVAVGFQGKLKTTFQMIAIVILLLTSSAGIFPHWFFAIGIVLLYLAAMLTVTSGAGYFKVAMKYFTT